MRGRIWLSGLALGAALAADAAAACKSAVVPAGERMTETLHE